MVKKTKADKSFKNKAGTSNEVGIMDEIGISMLKHQISNLYDEKAAFEQGLETAIKSQDNYKQQSQIDLSLRKLEYDNFGMNVKYNWLARLGRYVFGSLEHKVKYKKEFWALQKEKFLFDMRSNEIQDKSQMEGFEAEIERSSERIEQIKEQLATKIETLTGLGEEIPINPYDEE